MFDSVGNTPENAGRRPAAEPPKQILQFSRAQGSLIDLTQPWQNLFAESGFLPTQDVDWILAAIQTFHSPNDLHIATVETVQGLGIDAVAPLVMQGIGAVGHLVFLSQTLLRHPMDVLARDEAAMKTLLRQMVNVGRPIYLQRVLSSSPLVALLAKKPPLTAAVHISPAPSYPVLTLDDSWVTPEARISTEYRQHLERSTEQALQVGQIRPSILSPRPDQLAALLSLVFRIEAAGHTSPSVDSIIHNPQLVTFFMRYAALAAAKGTLRILMLHLDAQPAAMQFAVELGDRLWLLRSGHDLRFANCHLDEILMRHAVAYAAAKKLLAYEILGRSPAWIANWQPQHRGCVAIRIYPRTPRGTIAMLQRPFTSQTTP